MSLCKRRNEEDGREEKVLSLDSSSNCGGPASGPVS